jgi:putative transposase
MIRTYTIRLQTTQAQVEILRDLLEHLCVLYNQALMHRKSSWKNAKESVSLYDQQKKLTDFRNCSSPVSRYPAAIQRDPLRRVDLAFRGFYRRIKAKENPGYPRFKPSSQYDSFDVDSQNFRISGDAVTVVKLGSFRFKTKYKLKGEPKILRVQRRGKHWIASVVCYIGEAPTKVAVSSAIGIDLGLTSLATLSDGTEIENPRWTKQESARLARANQSLARKKRGSKNRLKAKERLRRAHQRIAGLRASYLTGVAKDLVGRYDLIAHENLSIRNMVRSNLAKSIHDASWGKLIQRLNCEAEKAGKTIVAVNPRGTTINCSACGEKVPKTLSQRVHNCPSCGLILGRDHNAALNVLRLGESLVGAGNTLAPQN